MNKDVQPQLQNAFIFISIFAGFIGINILRVVRIPPRGNENRHKVKLFLAAQCPKQAVTISDEDRLGSVAALYDVIRSGDDEVASRAITFAGENEFGYASPYVIQRLESKNPKVRDAARDFLKAISGTDYGPSKEAWYLWWRDPPKNILGLKIGQWTFTLATPILVFLWGLLIGTLAWILKNKLASVASMVLTIPLACFQCIVVAFFYGLAEAGSCTFGNHTIKYWSRKGTVVGLEDIEFWDNRVFFICPAIIILATAILFLRTAIKKFRRNSLSVGQSELYN
jgi:hypothetical protein